MKKVLILGVILLFSVAFAATNKIVVEGEKYSSITPSMTAITDVAASGNKCVHIPLKRPHATTETGPGDSGHCIYKINVANAGIYQLWARVHWYDGCGNSFFVNVDNGPTSYITDATYQRWHWVKGAKFTLSVGSHTIKIQNREDGAKLDQFILTNNTRYVPTSIE